MSKTQRRIGCDAALAVNDACDAVHRHLDLAREFGSRDAKPAQFFGKMFTGIIAYIMWGFIHVLYLIGWSNRIITLYSWLRALSFTHHRGERIITVEQAHDELTRAATRRDRDEFNRLLSKRA